MRLQTELSLQAGQTLCMFMIPAWLSLKERRMLSRHALHRCWSCMRGGGAWGSPELLPSRPACKPPLLLLRHLHSPSNVCLSTSCCVARRLISAVPPKSAAGIHAMPVPQPVRSVGNAQGVHQTNACSCYARNKSATGMSVVLFVCCMSILIGMLKRRLPVGAGARSKWTRRHC